MLLTAQQQEILRLLADGLSTRDIAFILDIHEKGAQGLATKVLDLCGLTGRHQAKAYLERQGSVAP
jgi:DNA-binding CsgD family transcriptional regulator